jgi:hypothetical protein
MRLARVAYEASVVQVEKLNLTPEALIDNSRKWAAGSEPSVIHVQSDAINKFCLVAGHSAPVIEELSFGASGVRFSLTDASFSQTLPKADYLVTRYRSSADDEAWCQYELRLAFAPLFRMLLSRFSELAGRALTGRLCERLSIWAAENGWNVAITSNGIVNRQYFEALETAVKFYVDLINSFQAEASPALGARMIDGIIHDVLIKLDPYRRDLLTRYIFSQAGVGHVAGVIQR